MSREKATLEQAREVAEQIKKKYKLGKSTCPKWFGNTCTPMQQDGSYSVAVCVSSWTEMTEEEKNEFLNPIDGVNIYLRIVTPPTYKKQEPEKKEEEDAKKKKRGPNR